jgi:hypothetical protein
MRIFIYFRDYCLIMSNEKASSFCPNCGSPNTNKKKFCANCGTSLIKNEITPPESQIQPDTPKNPKFKFSKKGIILVAGGIIILIIILFLTGYFSILSPQAIVGTYKEDCYATSGFESARLTIDADGSFHEEFGLNGQWKILGNKLVVQSVLGYSGYSIGPNILQSESGTVYHKCSGAMSSSSMSSAPTQSQEQPAYVVGASARRSGGNIVVTYDGGAGAAYLTRFDVTIIGVDGKSDHTFANAPSVGYIFTFPGFTNNGRNHIICTGTFTDGVQRTILDTYL